MSGMGCYCSSPAGGFLAAPCGWRERGRFGEEGGRNFGVVGEVARCALLQLGCFVTLIHAIKPLTLSLSPGCPDLADSHVPLRGDGHPLPNYSPRLCTRQRQRRFLGSGLVHPVVSQPVIGLQRSRKLWEKPRVHALYVAGWS